MSPETLSLHRAPAETRNQSAFRDRSRAEFVYEALRKAISTGDVRRGERVREEEVAKALGVSRTPVREALHRLQTRGLLEMVGGRGLVVAELTKQQSVEIYAMREILEGSAARFAAQHASDSDIAALHRLLDQFVQAKDDPSQMAKIDRRFHGAIYEAAHNRYLTQSLEQLFDSLALMQSTTFTAPGRPSSADQEHRLIVSAIEQRNPDAAEEAAREHIRRARQVRLDMMLNPS